MEYALQPATPEHLATVFTWITTPESLKLWGGPNLTFPPAVDKTWQEIGTASQNMFALIDTEGNVAGFGQLVFREPAIVHFARIIVSPALRGKGVGRVLCQQLMNVGSALYQPCEFTLSVYKNNLSAFKLYASLGFSVIAEDLQQNWFKMHLLAVHVSPGEVIS